VFFFQFLTTLFFGQNIYKEHVKAMGGEEALKGLRNVVLDQVLYSNNYEIPQKTIIIINKGFFQETTFPGNKMIVSMYDNKGWQINPYVSNKTIPLTSQEVQNYIVASRFLSPLYDFYVNKKDSYVQEIKIVGEKEIDNDICYQLLVNYKSGFIETIYMSKKTFLIRKIENKLGSTFFYNFKKNGGITMAQNTEITNHMGTIVSEILTAKINQKIDVKIFNKQ